MTLVCSGFINDFLDDFRMVLHDLDFLPLTKKKAAFLAVSPSIGGLGPHGQVWVEPNSEFLLKLVCFGSRNDFVTYLLMILHGFPWVKQKTYKM